ncbi:MAG: DUF4271 domain-containing protein [Bacteroidia bacterium]
MPIDTLHTTSIFEGHLLQPKHEKPELHFTHFDFGIAAILLAAFAIFVWLYASNRKRLNQVVRAFYVSRYTNQLGRDELTLGNRVTISLAVLFIVTSSLFATQVAEYYHYSDPCHRTLFFSKAMLLITGAYITKLALVRFSGFIFQTQRETSDYTLLIFLFCDTLGLFLLPVVICLAFVSNIPPLIFIYGGLGLFAIFLLIRILRGFLIGLNSVRVSRFYLFLYLCTLEILPFVVIVKLFMINLQ